MISFLDYPRTRIKMYATTDVERTKRLCACSKETETVDFIEGVEPGVFFDIGANVGSYSFVAAANNHKVYAFEPAGPTFERLELNCDLNADLAVMAYPILLGDRDTIVCFAFSSADPGAALHSVSDSGTSMAMWRLDSAIEEMNLPWPDYLKIDTDGSELQVLAGAEKALRTAQSLQVELDDLVPESMQIPAFLDLRGFHMTSQTRHGETSISNARFDR